MVGVREPEVTCGITNVHYLLSQRMFVESK